METCQEVAMNEDIEGLPSAEVVGSALLVNGIVEEKLKVAETADDLVEMDELKVNIDDMTLLENDGGLGSPKINEALTDELKFELKTVLSNHFSHECLSKDKFLRTQMDYDQFIPISIVAELEDVKKITENLTSQSKMDAIIKTLQEIKFVQLSDGNERVRRVIERSTLMLREIPASVSEKEIRGIFTGDGCPPMISCEYVVNDNWYVHFGSEEDANRAYRFVKETKKTFLDKPIMARFKGKSALTGSYILQNSENGPVCPPPVQAAAAQAQAPSLVQPTTANAYLGYFPSSYGYGFAEQPLPYYGADCNTFVRAYPSACPIGSCTAAVMPFNCYYPTAGDHQTTVELINARQRKPHPRFGNSSGSSSSGYYGRSDQSTHDHKQPPRFNRKRSEGTMPADYDAHQPTTLEDVANTSANRLTSRHEATGSSHMSHVASDSKPSGGGGRYGPRRGGGGGGGSGGRGRRNRWNQESSNLGASSKRSGSDGGGGPKTASFELETSSFPPLSSGKTNVIPAPVAVAKMCDANIQVVAPLPTESSVSNRVDQSTATDANDLVAMTTPDPPVASSPRESLPSSTSKFSYAQIAKRLKEPPPPPTKVDFTTNDATSSATEAQPPTAGKQEARNETKGVRASSQSSPSPAKKDDSPKEWRNYHPRNRPQRPRAQPENASSKERQ